MPSRDLWRIARIALVSLVLAAAAAGLVLGDAWLWTAVQWSPPTFGGFGEDRGLDTYTTVALLVAALVKAAFLWLILRTPVPGPLNGRERALRGLLYLVVAYSLVLWIPIALLPDVVDAVFQLALWTAINVLYLRVIRWRSSALRALAGALFAVEVAAMANDVLDELDLADIPLNEVAAMGLGLAGVAVIVVTVIGQWRDGRWSRATQVFGLLSVSVYALVLPLNVLVQSGGDSMAISVLVDAVGLLSAVWIAATAREMPAEERLEDLVPRRQRMVRVGVAAVAVLPIIAMIHPEQNARTTYTTWRMDCFDRPSFGDLKPAERDSAFLCQARSREGGLVQPMFPDSLSDQEILAYGRALCRAEDRDEQEAILTQAGSARPGWGADPWDLVYVCPEIVGATHPELLRSSEENRKAHVDYIAEQNARCRDPWPRTKGVAQATANYFLFADGDAGYLVYDPEGAEGAVDRAMERVYEDKAGIGVAGSAVLVGHVEDVIHLCLTVKALRTAPPRRTAGWEQVNEVPIVSRSGTLTVPEMGEDGDVGAGAPMPNLAINGKGRYRLRVYVRVGDTGEEHLVVVFPGTSRKRLRLKP